MGRLFQIICTVLLIFLFGCGGKSKSHTYTIGIDPSWYPLQIAGQDRNILAFSIELLTRIAKEENLQLAVQEMSWDNLFWGLQENKYGSVLSALRPYIFYQKKFSFSQPYLQTGPVIIAAENSLIKNANDLKGKEIAVVRGSSAALLLQTTPEILLQGYDSAALALEALENQDVNAAVLDVLIAQNYVKNLYRGIFKIVGKPLNNEGLRLISLYQQVPTLIKRFDHGLETLKKSGEYRNLLRKWGLSADGENISLLDAELEKLKQQLNHFSPQY